MRATQLEASRPAEAVPTAGARSLVGRVSSGHIVMVVAALLAGLLNYGLIRSGDHTVPVSTAATDLPAGHRLTAADLTSVRIAADEAVLATLLRPDDADALEGVVTTGPLHAGDLIRSGDLVEARKDGLRAMSLPIDPAHAAGGSLQAGDLVDVITHSGGRAHFALTATEVLTVNRAGGAALAAGGQMTLTLAVDDRGALRLAAAMAAEELHVVRATGAPPATESASGEGSASPTAAPDAAAQR